MTAKLVLENLKHKPIRSPLSVFLIAALVTLILCLVGLSHGMLDDSAAHAWRRRRYHPASARYIFTHSSGAPIPQKMLEMLQKQPHVAQALGMIVNPSTV